MRSSSLLPGLALLLPVTLAFESDAYTLFEKLNTVPRGWVLDSAEPDPSDVITLRVHVKQQNVETFEKKLIDISTPGNPQYGNHMQTDAIRQMLQPSDDSLRTVCEWLESHGLGDDMMIDSDWIYANTTTGKAESMLQTKYQTYSDIDTGTKMSRTLSYSVPHNVKRHINLVHPTTSFARARALKSTVLYHSSIPEDVSVPASCDSSITPTCLADLYGFSNYTPSATPAKMSVAGFLEQWPQYSDLSAFLAKYALDNSPSDTFPCTLVNGGTCNQTTDEDNIVEANLDIQYAVGINGKIPTTYYSTGGRPPLNGGGTNTNEPYLDFLNYLMGLSDADLPTTVSISYGDTEDTVPLSYAQSVCNLFAQVGARGVSILAASGDGGADCSETSGGDVLVPIFPGGCPYLTTVGALVGVAPEAAVDFSGGGFSNYFARPSYQDAAVSAWIAGNNNPDLDGLYNATGRAFPDVSAQGSNFHVFIGGSDGLVGGTSASTPAFSSVINLVSNQLLIDGKSPLGFLNPFLYSTGASALTDITSGSSEGCGDIDNGVGFTAVTGWDPVTGLGSPNFNELLAAAGDS